MAIEPNKEEEEEERDCNFTGTKLHISSITNLNRV
jgi:hypothetical protein